MKRIFDASFRYRPSFDTDIRRTFSAFRRRTRAATVPPNPAGNVAVLPVRRTRTEPKT